MTGLGHGLCPDGCGNTGLLYQEGGKEDRLNGPPLAKV